MVVMPQGLEAVIRTPAEMKQTIFNIAKADISQCVNHYDCDHVHPET